MPFNTINCMIKNGELSWTTDFPTVTETVEDYKRKRNRRLRTRIKKVVFNGPATIVFWKDGTKTVVKCGEGEHYDKEKGLLAAMAKKYYEDTNIFVEELIKWCQE